MSDVRDSEDSGACAPTDKGDETNGNNTEADVEPESINEHEESTHDIADEDDKFDKLDELTSLEREIAEMHHVEPTAPSIAQKVKDGGVATLTHNEFQRDKVLLEMQPVHKTTSSFRNEGEFHHQGSGGCVNSMQDEVHEPLEEEDLIAVLKGVVDNDHQTESADEDNDVAVGVTIEGEGEFQIMEIDDDIDECEEMNIAEPTSSVPVVTTNTFVSNVTKLTKEEERNLAMEQIQGLKSRTHSKKLEQNKNRRKQDIKPLPVESADLVSMLGADWSEDEMIADPLEGPAAAGTSATAAATSKESKSIAIPAMKIPSRPIATATTTAVAKDKLSDKTNRRNSPPKITSVVLLKGGSSVQQTVESTIDEETTAGVQQIKKEPEVQQTTVAPIQQTTGFKRTRIIKRKIIWDPDAPETTFSYAQLVRPSNISPKIKSEPVKAAAVVASGKSAATPSTLLLQKKNQEAAKRVRPVTPKDKKILTHSDAPAANVAEAVSAAKRVSTPKVLIKSTTLTAVAPKEIAAATKQVTKTNSESGVSSVSPTKRRSQTPVANGASKKKKITEIDRLMGDEGAVNMLNSLESERQKKINEQNEQPKSNMRSRSATISEKFVKRDLTPSKKEAPAATPKTKRVVKPKASASWDYVYKQQASEDSMIIRRRSNSSYSSSASVHRLSLDASPANSTKGTQKAPPRATKAGQAIKSDAKPQPQAKQPSQATATDHAASDGSLKTNNSSSTVKAFEFAKPESKIQQKIRKTKSPQAINPLSIDIKKSSMASLNNRRIVRSPSTVEEKEKSAIKSPITVAKEDGPSIGIQVRKLGKVAQVIFNTSKSKIENTFNLEILNNFIETLTKLEADTDCHAVAVTTNGANFCQGLDISELAVGSLEKRKKFASQLGAAVKNFLKTLATFPKPIIAGVNGANVGLGVMILPLFDIIIASDKGSYETPYAKIGQLPEGYCIWNGNNKIRGTFKTKLFWSCEKLHSTESALSGLVNKLTTPNKVNEDAVATAKRLASFSAETYRTMKKTSIDAIQDIISVGLEQEFKTIIEQWSSEECFENFKKYTQTGHW